MSLPAAAKRSVVFTGLGLQFLGAAFYVQALSFSRLWQSAGQFAAAGVLLALAHAGQARRRRLHKALRAKDIRSAPLPDSAYLALLCLAAVMIALPTLLWLRWREAQMLELGARHIDPQV